MDTMEPAKLKVILVEDHKVIRSFLNQFVGGMVCCEIVAEAVCGVEAIEIIRTVLADLIILDLSLPGRGGLEVLREAKKLSTAKILAFTMMADEQHIKEALNAGVDGICLKDRGIKILEQAILEVLEGKHPIYLENYE